MFKFSPHTKLFVFTLLFLGFSASAQTEEQVLKITSSYDPAYLQTLAAQYLKKSTQEKKEAVDYARAKNLPIAYTTKDGSYVELQRIHPDGTLIYYQTHNAAAARSTRVNHLNTGGSTGYNLDGQNMIAYVWDAGHPRVSHQEYDGPDGNNRVSIMDLSQEGGLQLHRHAAHVTGTLIASGVDSRAKGMAPKSKVKAYKWNNDLGEATSAVSNGMLISNHSYGYKTSDVPDDWFGAYRERSQIWDNLMFNAPYYLMVNSAGNDGTNNTANGAPLNGASEYDKLSGMGTSKNNLVVASANDAVVGPDGTLSSVEIVPTSSQGPTDDLRIKPDITGNGFKLYSTYESSDAAYGTLNGTSMAAPNVTGSLLLLQQHYNAVTGNFMRAATLKGLALHTADDAGPVGPDPIWGWGLLNAKKAAETISQNGSNALIQELVITQGQTITLTLDSDGINDLMASISWTDRAGAVNNELNSTIATLVNDLDIRVEKDGIPYFPWRLTGVNSNDKGDNIKDPFERVEVENASGSYTISVSHKGNLVGGRQAFSLIVTGVDVICVAASVPQNVMINNITASGAEISWDAISGSLFDVRLRKTENTSWTEITGLSVNNYEISGLEAQTEYEFQVLSQCPYGEKSEYSPLVGFSTLDLAYCESSSVESGDPNFHISNVQLNTINNTSGGSLYTDFSETTSTELVAGQTYSIAITTASEMNYRTSYSVWIDYNLNGHFDDPGEQIFTSITDASIVASGSFTVPVNISPLSTRMRVSMTNDELPAGPCDLFSFGEVEDYGINLRLPTDFVYENDVWLPTDPAGFCTSEDNIVVINGRTIFTTDISANNLTVNSGASLEVEKVLNIAGNLTNNGELIFVSSETGNGELGPISEGATVSGNVTVQRYMQNKRAYRMVSSAVSTANSIKANWQEGSTSNTHNPAPGFGTHITGSTMDQQNGFDGTISGAPSMYYVPNGTQSFAAIANTTVNKLVAGFPYLLYVRGDRSIDLRDNNAASSTILRAKGSLYYGEHIQEFPSVNSGNFVMFGNPYQSAVDINSVFANSDNLNTNFYYLYDPADGTLGAFKTVDLTENDGYQYLQPGQAAQVKVNGPAVIRFNESDKAPGNFTATNRTILSGTDKLVGQLFTTENFLNEGPLHDSFVIRFSETYDNEITSTDAVKPMNFYENLGIDRNGTYLSIERRKKPQSEEVYQLLSSGYQYSDYTLKLTLEGLEGVLLSLRDNFTGTITALNNGDNIYNFNVQNNLPLSKAIDRFSIHTEERLGVSGNSLLSGISLFPNPMNDNAFNISAPNLNGETVLISVTDMLGREVYNGQRTFSGNTIKIILSRELNSGVYIVTISSKGESQNLRVISR